MRDFSDFFNRLFATSTIDFDNHNGFSPAFSSHIHLSDIDIETREASVTWARETSWCTMIMVGVFMLRETAKPLSSVTWIFPHQWNSCHTDGLMVILYSDFSGVWVRSVAVFLASRNNLTLMGEFLRHLEYPGSSVSIPLHTSDEQGQFHTVGLGKWIK